MSAKKGKNSIRETKISFFFFFFCSHSLLSPLSHLPLPFLFFLIKRERERERKQLKYIELYFNVIIKWIVKEKKIHIYARIIMILIMVIIINLNLTLFFQVHTRKIITRFLGENEIERDRNMHFRWNWWEKKHERTKHKKIFFFFYFKIFFP